jgi:arylsulfatase A-like enzyme
MTDFGVLLAPHPTLPELLKRQGYVTPAFIGLIILDSRSLARGLDRGFDYYDNFPKSSKNKSRWNRLERRAGTVVEHTERKGAHPKTQRLDGGRAAI